MRKFLIQDCQIEQNVAANSGGGIYLTGSGSESPRLVNCLVTGNNTRGNGGGISCNQHSEVIISNCTIADNSATIYGGGLYAFYGSIVEVIDSIIWSNRSNEGSQVAVGGGDPNYPLPSTLKISYTDIGPRYDANATIVSMSNDASSNYDMS